MKRTTAVASLVGLVAAVTVVLTLVGGPGWRHSELPVLGQVPAFTLLDQNGASIDTARLRGRPWVASFLYTSCPGPCPILVEHLAQLRRKAAPADLAIVSFSVDPNTDTVEVLNAYAKAHGIDAEQRWWLLTGSEEEIWNLVRKGFLSAIGREPSGGGPAPEGPILHSTRLLLVDGEGRIRGAYPSEDPQALLRLEGDAKDLPSLPSRPE